jgi:hypothetical protein
MLTLNVTNRIIKKITVWLIPTRQRFDNCLLKKFNYMYSLIYIILDHSYGAATINFTFSFHVNLDYKHL